MRACWTAYVRVALQERICYTLSIAKDKPRHFCRVRGNGQGDLGTLTKVSIAHLLATVNRVGEFYFFLYSTQSL
jgi:hypothetical protein